MLVNAMVQYYNVRMNPVQDQEEEEELRRNPLLKIVIAVWSYCVDR